MNKKRLIGGAVALAAAAGVCLLWHCAESTESNAIRLHLNGKQPAPDFQADDCGQRIDRQERPRSRLEIDNAQTERTIGAPLHENIGWVEEPDSIVGQPIDKNGKGINQTAAHLRRRPMPNLMEPHDRRSIRIGDAAFYDAPPA